MEGGFTAWWRRWSRRLLTLPGVVLAALVGVLSAPVWLPILVVLDGVHRSPWPRVRCGLFFTWFAICETVGLGGAAVALIVSVGRPDSRTDRMYALQRVWSGAIFGGAQRLFGFDVRVDGVEAAAPAPMLLFMRHASTADTMLPAVLIANRFGTRLRYVMKRELLLDPCLDIVGHRVPNCFVDRFSDDSTAEIAAIARLGVDLGPQDGVVIFPEGTRFTEAKRRRIIERRREAGDLVGVDQAKGLASTLPPRLGGPLALLESASESDVVFCVHSGFEAVGTLPSLWRGALVGRTVDVKFWRVPRARVPEGEGERASWLYEQWRRMDAWLAERR